MVIFRKSALELHRVSVWPDHENVINIPGNQYWLGFLCLQKVGYDDGHKYVGNGWGESCPHSCAMYLLEN